MKMYLLTGDDTTELAALTYLLTYFDLLTGDRQQQMSVVTESVQL